MRAVWSPASPSSSPADILATSIAPNWDELLRLATVAVIRTLLNFFLEKDLSEVRRRQFEPADCKFTSE
jgi:hypothetical protein